MHMRSNASNQQSNFKRQNYVYSHYNIFLSGDNELKIKTIPI